MDCRYGQAKWCLPKGFPKGLFLYNLANARLSDYPRVLLVEGPGDVFAAAAAGIPAVAVLGHDLSPTQADKLATLSREIVVAFDNDPEGQKGAWAAYRHLSEKKISSGVWSPPESFHDLGEMPPEEVLRWLKKREDHFDELDRICGVGHYANLAGTSMPS